MKYHFVWLMALMLVTASASPAATVESLATGRPAIATQIGAHSFVPVQLRRLKNAKVWYVDYEWHRAHGIDVPADGIASESFRNEILNAYAWQSKTETDDDSEFSDETKKSFADYYGGGGAGTNHGSGRAAAFGIVQLKGVKTSLAKSTDPWHSNGAVQSIEAVDEAIWSQLLDGEFNFGSNKVVAVILTGTYGRMKDGQVFPRALIVREMGVRPAHYMLSPARQFWSTPGDGALDTHRVETSLKGLLSALPVPKTSENLSEAEKIRAGFFELIDREATAQAEYVSHRLFFGSFSPSNMEITGRRLDLGDHTSQDGYTPIYRVEHLKETPFGSIKAIEDIFEEMRSSLSRTLPVSLRESIPTRGETKRAVNARFEFHRAVEFVRLSGVPDEVLETLAPSASVQTLGQLLFDAAQAGRPSDAVFTDPNGWVNSSEYDVNRLLVELAKARTADVIQIRAVATNFISDAKLAAQIADAYGAFLLDAKRATRGRISQAALATFMKEAAVRRNLDRPGLVRGHRRWRELWDTTDHAIANGAADPTLIQKYIEARVSENLSDVKTDEPFTLVISEETDSAAGLSVRRLFDAKTNSYRSELRLAITNGSVHLRGQTLALRDLPASGVFIKGVDGSVAMKEMTRPAVIRGDKVIFDLGSSPATLSALRFADRSQIAVEMSSRLQVRSCRSLFR